MTHLLILRHGPTEWNALKRLQGRSDIPLSEAGRQEVRCWRLPAEFADYAWVSSPLLRAVQTAKLMGADPLITPALTEMSWGDWEGLIWQDLLAASDPVLDANRARGLDFRPANGESPRDVQNRLASWIATREKPTIAVTHKGVLQALYALATGWQMTNKSPVKIQDGCAHLFDVSGLCCKVLRMNITLKGEG
ncbi:MAG: histidine phosphatase family protein [Rhodospirillales bacterium]|nr:histidine phosphatase family protein [Rhodospirillales bacterium]